MKNSKMLIMGLLVSGAVLTGCQTGEADGAAEENTYVIGLDDTFAPMGFRDDDGELVGFDIDLGRSCG
ncbi:MAG: transporter substrate-binding domain-containing protein [Alkalibacterium sp.]|nr:transporter substrate-binding domain-containing protein [Alkalibacterium sp.]